MSASQQIKIFYLKTLLNENDISTKQFQILTEYSNEDGSIKETELWNHLDTFLGARLGWKLALEYKTKLEKLQKQLKLEKLQKQLKLEKQLKHTFIELNKNLLHNITRNWAASKITAAIRQGKVFSNKINNQILNASINTYKELGWGWNEKVYQEALKIELEAKGFRVRSEVPRTILYKGQPLGDGVYYRTDIIVSCPTTLKKVLLELKADQATNATIKKAKQQLTRYLNNNQQDYSPQTGLVLIFPEKEAQRVKAFIV